MNEIVKKAYEINQNSSWDRKLDYIPELEIGEKVELNDLWDGCGSDPTENGEYTIKIDDTDWIIYFFEVIEMKENPLETIIKITGIDLL